MLAIIVIAALGLAGIAKLYEQSKAALVTAAEVELRDTAGKAAEEADRLFEPAPLIVNRLQDARLPELDQLQLERILFAIASYPVYSYPQVNGVYVGTVEGSFFHVTDLNSRSAPDAGRAGIRIQRSDPARAHAPGADHARICGFYEDADTKAWATASTKPVPPGYDPRERPWFKAGRRQRRFDLGQPYLFASTGDLGITLSAPDQGSQRRPVGCGRCPISR